MILELTTYIENNSSFVIDTDLFAVRADSDKQAQAITVAEPSPGMADGWLEGKQQVPFNIYSRAEQTLTARGNAFTVFNLLHRSYQISLPIVDSGPTYIVNIICRTPYFDGLDVSSGRFVYIMPIDVELTNTL